MLLLQKIQTNPKPSPPQNLKRGLRYHKKSLPLPHRRRRHRIAHSRLRPPRVLRNISPLRRHTGSPPRRHPRRPALQQCERRRPHHRVAHCQGCADRHGPRVHDGDRRPLTPRSDDPQARLASTTTRRIFWYCYGGDYCDWVCD